MSKCFCGRPTGADWKYSRNKFHTNVCSRYCLLTAEQNLTFKVNRTFSVECYACPNTFALKSQYNHSNQRFCCQECSRKVLKVKGGRKHCVILTAFYESRTGLTAEDIALICHAHPTLSESMKEAASLSSTGQTLHF